jgi:PAS domain S-box-containing protein
MPDAVGFTPPDMPDGSTPPSGESHFKVNPPRLAEFSSILKSLCERLRTLLGAPVVSILLREGTDFTLQGLAAESEQRATRASAGYDRQGLQFATEVVSSALQAGETISVPMDAAHALGEESFAGALTAAPFRSSQKEGAVLVYPRTGRSYGDDEKAMIAAITDFAAVAASQGELLAIARGQNHEQHQLLDIASEMSRIGEFSEFMQKFALRAADFLGFDGAFVALLEEDSFLVRWEARGRVTQERTLRIPEGPATRALKMGEVFWLDQGPAPGADSAVASAFQTSQMLAVPLLGSEGQVLGVLGTVDRLDKAHISGEDIRVAKVLGAQVAAALQVTRSLQLSEQHRQRAESLTELAFELNSLLRLPEFAKGFVSKAASMLGARAGALAVKQNSTLETLAIQGSEDKTEDRDEASTARRLNYALSDLLSRKTEDILSSTAEELLGGALATALGWNDCIVIRLSSPSGECVGVLCLANRDKTVSREDEHVLRVLAGQASVAMENARLFTRMDHANRHWMEIFDAIGDFIVVHDGTDNIMRVNRSLADFIGVPPRELIGVNMGALLAMDSAAPLRACPFCRESDNANDEYVHPGLGSTFLVSTSRVHSESSEGMQTIHVLKDITDRREAERRYRELFGNIQEGLFFSTPEGVFVEVNDALVRMLGYASREELLQVDVRTQVYGSPERFQSFSQPMQLEGVVRNHQELLRRKDGSAVYVLINAFAVRDTEERITQYRGLMLDITDLKAYQSELQRERDFSGKILNNTQSLILVTDTTGLISYANRRWRDMGYEQKQVLAAPMENLVAPARRQSFRDAFAAILSGQQVDNLDLQILRGDGRIGQFSVNLSPMRDEQGNVTSIVAVMSDITDAATLQAKLMHAEKMAAVGQLVSGVAHEVNNPLTAILGFADLLMENSELPESARKDLRVILQEAQRTKQNVQNLLSFARQMPPQRRPVELNSILRRTVQLRAYDFQSHGIEVVEDMEQELPYVIGDSQQLQQVFLNIVNNAYDAVRETGRPARIEVKTMHRRGLVEVSFRDNGHGISFPERIFDPFFTTKEVGKGTGLGLSICYGIVREHGGEILCHNNQGAEGATFIVRFPAAPETASVGAAAGVIQR